MIYATPRRTAKGASQWAAAHRAVVLTGLAVCGYGVFSATHGDLATIPAHITAAQLEERYGKYLDHAESLAVMPATDERNAGDKRLRALLERDDTVLWLTSTDRQPIFEYRKGGESASGFGCVGTSDPQQVGVMRCTIHGDLFGHRALRYRRHANDASDGASVMLDFRGVDGLSHAPTQLMAINGP